MGSVALIATLYELLAYWRIHVFVLFGFAVYYMRWQTGLGAFDPSSPFAIRLERLHVLSSGKMAAQVTALYVCT